MTVKNAWDYAWSSAPDHAGEREKYIIKLEKVKTEADWKKYLKESDIEMVNDIRLKTDRGLVVGTNRFVSKLEKILSRSLKCLNQGRPRKDG